MINLSESFKSVIADLIEAHLEQQSLFADGSTIAERVLTDLVEQCFFDEEFGDQLYDDNGNLSEEADARLSNDVVKYIESQLK